MEELIRIEITQGESKVIVFKIDSSVFDSGLTKVEAQRKAVLLFVQRELNDETVQISRDSDGVPTLENSGLFISISHSNEFYAVQLSKQSKVGVDVQCLKLDINKGVDYFVNDNEKENIDLSLKNLHLIWCAKEALYKRVLGQVKFYKEDMTVSEVGRETMKIRLDKKEFNFGFKETEEFTLVYAI